MENEVVTSSLIFEAFQIWARFIFVNARIENQQVDVPKRLQPLFQRIALSADLAEVLRVGQEIGFAEQSIVGIIILHGGYFRLVNETNLIPAQLRYIDSLYQHTFPSLEYYAKSKSLLAPWLTLSAQESLLDMPLKNMGVVEYGSGMSTFFFAENCAYCLTFESGNDLLSGESWRQKMNSVSRKLDIPINFCDIDSLADRPECIVSIMKERGLESILVLIDGENREKLFECWADWICFNQNENILLVIDNSERDSLDKSFYLLSDAKCILIHHYGNVYGQVYSRQCTSFATFHPHLLTGSNTAPSGHDKRWGKMNSQA